jgi:hypothetical protein
MNALITLPEDWANAARAIAEEQGHLPDSPAMLKNGSIYLCAAACIALAGFRLYVPGREKKFLADVLQTTGKKSVIGAFEELGLSANQCCASMKMNDSTLPTDRIRTFGNTLSSRCSPG